MVIVRRDYFSPEEKELYLSLFSDAKRQFNTYVDSGTVLNSKITFSESWIPLLTQFHQTILISSVCKPFALLPRMILKFL
jgi:hypothetical protein